MDGTMIAVFTLGTIFTALGPLAAQFFGGKYEKPTNIDGIEARIVELRDAASNVTARLQTRALDLKLQKDYFGRLVTAGATPEERDMAKTAITEAAGTSTEIVEACARNIGRMDQILETVIKPVKVRIYGTDPSDKKYLYMRSATAGLLEAEALKDEVSANAIVMDKVYQRAKTAMSIINKEFQGLAKMTRIPALTGILPAGAAAPGTTPAAALGTAFDPRGEFASATATLDADGRDLAGVPDHLMGVTRLLGLLDHPEGDRRDDGGRGRDRDRGRGDRRGRRGRYRGGDADETGSDSSS